MFDEVFQEAHRLRRRPTDNSTGVRRQEERLAAGRGVDANQPLPHGSKAFAFRLRKVREAELQTREELRMLADEVFRLGPRLVVECVVRGAHIGKLRIAPSGWDGQCAE